MGISATQVSNHRICSRAGVKRNVNVEAQSPSEEEGRCSRVSGRVQYTDGSSRSIPGARRLRAERRCFGTDLNNNHFTDAR